MITLRNIHLMSYMYVLQDLISFHQINIKV